MRNLKFILCYTSTILVFVVLGGDTNPLGVASGRAPV